MIAHQPCNWLTLSMSNFEQLIDRRGTHSTKWEKYAGRDILPFWIADMDFAVPGSF
ncbi:MAG: hypothetical protein CM15mP120_12280 [Pseudomonadota bacterium]|nr:MAG: hypothetical protein CM15mP120_12280 [Pseudomonadota bacterium]